MKTITTHENGLTLLQLQSQVTATGEVTPAQLGKLPAFISQTFGGQPQFAVFYLDYGIRFVVWQKGAMQCHEQPAWEFLQLGRVFNGERELKIWRDSGGWRYRLRCDEKGAADFAIDAGQNLWGTTATSAGLPRGWTRLVEERGVELVVPLALTSNPGEARPLAFVKTRNYIGYLPNGQSTYVDCRFVDLQRR